MVTLLRDVTAIRPGVTAVRLGSGIVVWTPPRFYGVLSTKYAFSTGVEGFTGGTGDTVAHETAAPISGTGSLRVTRSWGAGTDFTTARGPLIPAAERDWRANGADAIGVRVLVPAGTPGSGWYVIVRVHNSAGTVSATSDPLPVSVGLVTRVWAPTLPDVLADVAGIEVRVYANGVNSTSQHILIDNIATGASGALNPEEPEQPGSTTLHATAFTEADPKAALRVEPGTELDPANLTFPSVAGVPRARVTWPTVGHRRGYAGRTRFADLGVPGQAELVFEYGVLIPAATLADLAVRDLRLPSLAALPDTQPGTYTSGDGVQQPDSSSGITHVKAGGTTGAVLLSDDFTANAGTYTNSTSVNHPWLRAEPGDSFTIGSGLLSGSTTSGDPVGQRYISAGRFGGPGTSLRISFRARATALRDSQNSGTHAGGKIGLKFRNPNGNPYPEDDWRSVIGGTSYSPASFIFVTGIGANGRVELARNRYGTGYEPEFYSSTPGYTVGTWQDRVVQIDSLGGTNWRVRYWSTADGSGTPFFDQTVTHVEAKAAFLWVRLDEGDYEFDHIRVEEPGLAGGDLPPWGEVTAYVTEAEGRVPSDIYGVRFPLRPDLLPDYSGDRATWWSPVADKVLEFRERRRMNTPGTADGEWDLWVDGVQQLRLRKVLWRAAGQDWLLFNQLLLDVLYPNGGAPTAGRHVDLTHLRLLSSAALLEPGMPTGLTAGTVTATSIPVSWTAGKDATSHELLSIGFAGPLRGVNVAGAEFAEHVGVGTYDVDYHYDSQATFDYVASRGQKMVRLPFRWERVQPVRGQVLDPTLLGRLRAAVGRAGQAGLSVLLDMHNYCRRYENGVELLMGRDFPASDIVDVWTRLAAEFRHDPAVIGYGLMNEPHDLLAESNPTGAELITNPGFETDLTGWVGTDATVARDTAVLLTGVASMRVTAAAAADAKGTFAGIAVTAGSTYAVGYDTLGDASSQGKNAFVGIDWFDGAGAYLTSTFTGYEPLTTSWGRRVVQVTAPTGAASAKLHAGFQATAAGQLFWVDNVTFRVGTVRSPAQVWERASQEIVTGIRNAGDTTPVFVGGYAYSSAKNWATNHPDPWITDPANAVVYEAHYYFDRDNSGKYAFTYADENADAVGRGYVDLAARASDEVDNFTAWCSAKAVRGFLGEFGWPNTGDTAGWNSVGEAVLDVLDAAAMGSAYWAAGEWWGDTYLLSIYTGTPHSVAQSQAATVESHPTPASFARELKTGLVTSATKGGLDPATSHLFRSRSVNAAGKSAFTPPLLATTAAGTVTQAYLPADDFATAFGLKWTTVSGWTIDAGRAAAVGTGGFLSFQTDAQDWTEKASSLEVIDVPGAGYFLFFGPRIDANNNYELLINSGEFRLQAYAGGTKYVLIDKGKIAFDPVAHRFVRFRYSGTTLQLQTAPTGGPWTTQYSETARINMAVARERVMTNAPSGTTVRVDNSNVNAPAG